MFAITTSRTRLIALLAGLLLVIGFGAGPAHAQLDPYVSDEGQDQGDVGGGGVLPETGAPVDDDEIVTSTLPLTGGETLLLLTVGGALIAAGAGAVVVSRRRADIA